MLEQSKIHFVVMPIGWQRTASFAIDKMMQQVPQMANQSPAWLMANKLTGTAPAVPSRLIPPAGLSRPALLRTVLEVRAFAEIDYFSSLAGMY